MTYPYGSPPPADPDRPVEAGPSAGPGPTVPPDPYLATAYPPGQGPYDNRPYDPHLGFDEPPEDPRRKGTIIAAIVVGLVVAAAGLAIGVLWAHFAPRIGVVRVAQGFAYADSEPEEAVGADAWFAFLGLGAGLVFTVLAWMVLRRFRGVAMMVGLVLGSLVGAWLAWWLGLRIGRAEFEAVRSVAVGIRVNGPLGLRLTDLDRGALWPPKPTGVVAAQALAAAITYTVLAGFSIHPGLRPPPKNGETDPTNGASGPGAVSSDPDAPAGPPA